MPDRFRRTWLAAAAVLAAGVVVVFSVVAGAAPYDQVGSSDPGPVVAIGAPLLRLVADAAAAICVGALVFVVWCTRPGDGGLVAGNAYRELRWASRAAGVWAAAGFLLVPFSAADAGGQPLSVVLLNLPGMVGALEQPKAWLLTAVLALVVAAGARATLRWQPAVLWCAMAVFAVLPPLVTGHGSSDLGHDLTIAAIVVHVPAALIWLGVLLAVLREGRGGELLARYDRLAWCCLGVLALSGLVLGGVLVHGQRSAYGVVLAVKVAIVAAVTVAARIPARRAFRGRPSALLCAEGLALAAVMGISVSLSHLSLPDVGRTLTTAETLLGYDLTGPPTVARLLFDWRPDLFFGPLAVLLAAGYVVAARRRGDWPARRTAAWLAGCLVVFVATSSGIGRYAAAMFSVHQASHMLLGMLAPALLALGAPLRLLGSHEGTLPGVGEIVRRLSEGRVARRLTHPVVVLVLFAGSPFVLYCTGLFDAVVRFHWAHLLVNAWFLATGYLFSWVVAGGDPAPRPLPDIARLGLTLAAMPADIGFGAVLVDTGRVIGNGPASSNFYRALALPWVHDLAADQKAGGVVALVLGEVALLVVLGALLLRWNRLPDLFGEQLATVRNGQGQP